MCLKHMRHKIDKIPQFPSTNVYFSEVFEGRCFWSTSPPNLYKTSQGKFITNVSTQTHQIQPSYVSFRLIRVYGKWMEMVTFPIASSGRINPYWIDDHPLPWRKTLWTVCMLWCIFLALEICTQKSSLSSINETCSR